MTRIADEVEVNGQVFEVASNGRTVWVNNPACVARFCPVSREFQPTAEQLWCINHDDAKPTMNDWQHFVDHVKSAFGVAIDAKHLPTYLKPQ
jgi:hypothetical protein